MIYPGTVVRVDPGGVIVRVPLLGHSEPIGPISSGEHDLVVGERVAVSTVGLSRDELWVVGRMAGRSPAITEIPGLDTRLDTQDTRLTATEGVANAAATKNATQDTRLTATEGVANAAATKNVEQDTRLTATEGVANAAAPKATTTGLVTAKGDLLAGSAAGALARLPVGGNGLALVGASGQASGLTYAEVRGIPHGGGLAGATVPTRYVGATAAGPPTTGTFAVGDYIVSQDLGDVWVCTVAGTPGTWVSSAATLRTQLFGGPTRTVKPFAYGWMTNNVPVPVAVDTWLRHDNFTSLSDADTCFSADASTGALVWTCKVAGWYRGRFSTRWDIGDTGGIRICFATVNGSNASFMRKKELPAWAPNTGEGDTIVADGYAQFTVGTTLRFGVWQNSASARSWWNNSFSAATDVTMEFVRAV